MTATLDDAAAPAAVRDWRTRLLPLVHDTGGWGVTFLVTLVAGLLRFLRLDQPATGLTDKGAVDSAGHIFDEVYYACDAHNLVTYGVERASVAGAKWCTPGEGPAFVVHPPLGKWMIGIGEKLFGFSTFGWRFSAAVVGTLTVLLLVRIGRRMLGSDVLGGLAGLLLALDGMHFVESRTATLDIFLTFWVVAAFGAVLVDRDRVREQLSEATDAQLARGGTLGRRPWLMLAGVCGGAALATKWSGVFALAPLAVLVVSWEVSARRTAGIRFPFRATLRRSVPALLVAFAVLPVVVYVLSWSSWFLHVDNGGFDRHWADDRGTAWFFVPDAVRSWWHYHYEMWHFHQTLTAKHPYQSHPLSWPFLGRPVSYYYPPGIGLGRYGCTAQSCSREVLAIGTPAIWWAMVPACLALVARWVARRDWRAGALALMIAVPVLAWVPSDLKGRTMFLFYALPAIPFLCLGLALICGWALNARHRTGGAIGVGIYVSVVVVNFAWLYPVLAAVTLSYPDWYDRMWFRSWI
jgi:dolichyl-phosphate-mannose--protein O-mannosyl transferase